MQLEFQSDGPVDPPDRIERHFNNYGGYELMDALIAELAPLGFEPDADDEIDEEDGGYSALLRKDGVTYFLATSMYGDEAPYDVNVTFDVFDGRILLAKWFKPAPPALEDTGQVEVFLSALREVTEAEV